MTNWTTEEYRDFLKTGKIPDGFLPHGKSKQPKYHNKRTEYKGVVYDSRKEANRAWELDQLQKAGIIKSYESQVKYTLAAGIVYKADFVVAYPDGHTEIEDVKSEATRKDKVYRIKKRLMKSMGLDIKEV